MRITIISTGFSKETNAAAEAAEAEAKAAAEKAEGDEDIFADIEEAPKKKSVTGFDVDDFFNN